MYRYQLSVWMRRFQQDTSGSVMLIFTAFVLALCLITGGVVDLSRAYNVQTKMQVAADAAALAGANDIGASEAAAIEIAQRYFLASVKDIKPALTPSFSANRKASPTNVEMTVKSTAAVPTSLLSALGFKAFKVSVLATAGRSVNYVDLYAAVDMSASLGIAADPANRTKLKTLTSPYFAGGCAFACHVNEPSVPTPQVIYQIAKDNSVRLREDVLMDAFNTLVDLLMNPTDPNVMTGLRRMATYGFSDNLRTLQMLTKSATQLKTSLPTFPNTERMNTRFDTVLPQFASTLGISGDGSKANPKKLALLVTDGVQWDYGPYVGGAMNGSLCNQIKANGVTLAVLEVRYVEDTGYVEFEKSVRPFYTSISPQLEACALPGFYFKVQDSSDAQLAAGFADVAKSLQAKLVISK